jgi:hypothetical protein
MRKQFRLILLYVVVSNFKILHYYMKQLIEFKLTTESKRLKINVIKFQNQTNIGA